MNWRLDIKSWRFYVALTRSKRVKGVNSKLPDGNHFLMFDFDDKDPGEVEVCLARLQKQFLLPRIFLINTGLPGYFHGYCFQKHSWAGTLFILATCPLLDPVFFKIGVIRGYFTLRYSKKKGRDFQAAVILPSPVKEDVNPFELSNFVEYWTKRI